MVFCCKITIGNLVFDSFNQIEISKSWRTLTDTAKISIPKALHYYNGTKMRPLGEIRDYIKTGAKVEIELGYDRQLITEFEGYVARSPQPNLPITIECEDEMWQLKKKNIDVSLPDVTVEKIIRAAAPGYEINVLDEFYGDFSLLNTTPAKVFDELRKTSGIYVFFRNNVLTAGKVYTDEKLPETVANFKYGANIIGTDLRYVSPEDAKVKIYGTSIQADGSVLRAEIGEEGGDIVRANINEITKKQLEDTLKRKYEDYKHNGGYDGTITSFGFPAVQHGQKVRIVDDIYEKRDSIHFVDDVQIKVSMNGGYRRTIEIGKEAE